MKPRTLFLLSAGAVLALSAALLTIQSHQLEALRTPSKNTFSAAGLATHAPAAKARARTAPPGKRPEPEGQLLLRVAVKLIAGMKPEQLAPFYAGVYGVKLNRISLNAALDEAEQKAFQAAFNDFTLALIKATTSPGLSQAQRRAETAAINQRLDAWVASQLGPGRYAAVAAAETLAIAADAERNATRAVSRLSRATDLSVAQKDTLYTAFLSHARNPPSTPDIADQEVPLHFTGSMTEELSPPDIHDEARDILTPEQWKILEAKRNQPNPQDLLMQQAASTLAPAALGALQEILAEEGK